MVRRVLAYYQSGTTVVNSREYDSDVLPFRTAGIAAKTPAGAILFNGWDLSVLTREDSKAAADRWTSHAKGGHQALMRDLTSFWPH